MQVQAPIHPLSRSAAAMIAVATAAEPAAVPAETARSCGWYDSSFELTQGLEISEGLDETVWALWAQAAGLPQRLH